MRSIGLLFMVSRSDLLVDSVLRVSLSLSIPVCISHPRSQPNPFSQPKVLSKNSSRCPTLSDQDIAGSRFAKGRRESLQVQNSKKT